MTTVVFGSRGSVGGSVVTGLHALGIPCRVARRADLATPGTLARALTGARRVFLYAVPESVPFLAQALRDAGVRQAVLLSSAAIVMPGADRNAIADGHRSVEEAVASAGVEWTFLRGGVFATNTLRWWGEPIRSGRTVRLAYPRGLSAPVHERDLADLAVTALTRPGHAGAAWTVHGPATITVRDQVTRIAQAAGVPVTIADATPDETREDLARVMPAPAVEAVLRLWSGGSAETSTVVEEITGKPGRTFAQWATDHAADFRPRP